MREQRKCSFRFMFVSHRTIMIITQDMRRSRNVVTGRYMFRDHNLANHREMAKEHGCSVIIRIKEDKHVRVE